MTTISDAAAEEVGPIDFAVVEFPAGSLPFAGELGDELLRLVDTETVRLLDLVVVSKAADGTVDAVELADSGERDDIRELDRRLADVLAEDDVETLARAVRPGSVAGIVVWENSWAVPFAAAARRAGGRVVADGRIPVGAVLASLEDDPEQRDGWPA